jgi:hypothetical protein
VLFWKDDGEEVYRLHDITSQKTVTLIFSILRTINPKNIVLSAHNFLWAVLP